ncbi:hypothetical protein TvY486_0018050 [Trypanosoma vivax Y486]|uniref:Uncharacterized protein n=1 Tax=Trypanosoma vivax (strain Y486) TaxID=1055687 RepID=F9WNI1_TRYVY|nr:hypothetical protein TvY486_0018050 [Trypanosoma vivax Y486]|eukprot:CCD19099.1 hypothetical protein TvY486_0018050 [Trypanosoma vivax Y486]
MRTAAKRGNRTNRTHGSRLRDKKASTPKACSARRGEGRERSKAERNNRQVDKRWGKHRMPQTPTDNTQSWQEQCRDIAAKARNGTRQHSPRQSTRTQGQQGGRHDTADERRGWRLNEAHKRDRRQAGQRHRLTRHKRRKGAHTQRGNGAAHRHEERAADKAQTSCGRAAGGCTIEKRFEIKGPQGTCILPTQRQNRRRMTPKSNMPRHQRRRKARIKRARGKCAKSKTEHGQAKTNNTTHAQQPANAKHARAYRKAAKQTHEQVKKTGHRTVKIKRAASRRHVPPATRHKDCAGHGRHRRSRDNTPAKREKRRSWQ